jgi:hypothetical protein
VVKALEVVKFFLIISEATSTLELKNLTTTVTSKNKMVAHHFNNENH